MSGLGRRVAFLWMAVLTTAASVGCASGPSWKTVEERLPPPPSGHGRIVVYRPGVFFGAAVQPPVVLATLRDGNPLTSEVIGMSVPGGVFYVDRPAGDYRAACTTEVERAATFRLEPEEVQYLANFVTMGAFVGHVHVALEDPRRAKPAVAGMSYVGADASRYR